MGRIAQIAQIDSDHSTPPIDSPVAQVRHERDAAGPGRSSAGTLVGHVLPTISGTDSRSHLVVQGRICVLYDTLFC